MKKLFVLVAALFILPAFLLPEAPTSDKPFTQMTQAEKNQLLYKGRSSMAKRFAGARLRAKASVVPKQGKPDEIIIDWTLDYNGPRPPLIILKPSLEVKSRGQTEVIFYAEGKNGYPYEFHHKSPAPLYTIQNRTIDDYLIIDKGKTAAGKIRVSMEWVRFFFQLYLHPSQYGKEPPVIHVQLRHKPYERMDVLDAWTGELYSKVHKVNVKKW